MKKKLFSIFSLVLCAIMAIFSGAGCGEAAIISSLTNNWEKSSTAQIGYSEIQRYTVEYSKNTSIDQYNYALDSDLEKYVSISFVDGAYTSTIKVLSTSQVEKNKTSDILTGLSVNDRILYLETQLSITANYIIDGETKSYNDFVKSECYFLTTDKYLSPIYSMTENNCAILTVTDKCYIDQSHFVNTINYNTSDYTVQTDVYEYGETQLIPENVKRTTSKKCAYKFNTLIDNASLIFATRNLNITEGTTTSIPIVSGVYGDAKSVSMNFDISTTENDARGTSHQVKRIVFGNGGSYTGRQQLIFIQSEKDLDYKSLPIKIVEPLTEYSTYYKCLGSLVYTLVYSS